MDGLNFVVYQISHCKILLKYVYLRSSLKNQPDWTVVNVIGLVEIWAETMSLDINKSTSSSNSISDSSYRTFNLMITLLGILLSSVRIMLKSMLIFNLFKRVIKFLPFDTPVTDCLERIKTLLD